MCINTYLDIVNIVLNIFIIQNFICQYQIIFEDEFVNFIKFLFLVKVNFKIKATLIFDIQTLILPNLFVKVILVPRIKFNKVAKQALNVESYDMQLFGIERKVKAWDPSDLLQEVTGD